MLKIDALTKLVWISRAVHDDALHHMTLAVLYVHAQHTIVLCLYRNTEKSTTEIQEKNAYNMT